MVTVIEVDERVNPEYCNSGLNTRGGMNQSNAFTSRYDTGIIYDFVFHRTVFMHFLFLVFDDVVSLQSPKINLNAHIFEQSGLPELVTQNPILFTHKTHVQVRSPRGVLRLAL